jgi:PEP-CTERM motif
MRASALVALSVGVLVAAPLAASADTKTVQFGIPIESGSLNRGFPSFSFSGFDPALGTLTDAILSLSGSLRTTSSSPTLTLTLSGAITALQTLTNPIGGQVDFDMEGSAPVIGSGSQSELFAVRDGGQDSRVFRTFLEGTVTYDYTPTSSILAPPPPGDVTVPLTVPEPSTWAMMLIGFAGLGYAALRGKAVVRRPST